MGRTMQKNHDCFLEQEVEDLLAKLAALGCPSSVLDSLRYLKSEAMIAAKKLVSRGKNSGRIPILPVVPFSHVSVHDQMEMVKGSTWEGSVDVNASVLLDNVSILYPYFIIDVEDGRIFRGRPLRDSLESISYDNRTPLTTAEGIALAIHSEVLRSHAIDLAGSRYREFDVPAIWDDSGKPILTKVKIGRTGFPSRGVPSKKEVVAPHSR